MKWAKRVQKYVNYDTVDDAIAAHGYDIVQPKLDGWWACAVVKGKHARIYSRQGLLKDTLPADGLPPCVLIGEYIAGTQRAVTSKSIYSLVVFDALEIAGGELWNHSYEYRMDKFDLTIGDSAPPWVERVASIPIKRAHAAWASHVEEGGAEGLVFRSRRHRYEHGVIGRVKKRFTMDYVVMDVLPGTGKHAERMGAVVCGLYDRGRLVEKVRVGGGWSDREREAIWRRPRAYIGRVLEVRGWQLFASGSMRHPQAVGFRDDKDAKQCVFDAQGGR